MALITLIGRGHSGTRIISETLSASGVYMGEPQNSSSDLIPAEDFYEACRIVARHVVHLGEARWDFSGLLAAPVDPAFRRLVESYLASVLESDASHRGWKLPETVLAYPWIVRLFPEARYVHWARDPRDCILDRHMTDELADFGVPTERTDDVYRTRALSWLYQREIVAATPPPRHAILVRFEDFVLCQEAALERLEAFVGFPLVAIPVRPEAVGRWRRTPEAVAGVADLLADELVALGYEPMGAGAGRGEAPGG